MTMDTFGIIGFTEDNVGIDRRIYTGSAINGETDPILPVSYNGGRVDVYLNGIKLVGDHSEMPSGTRDYTFTQTGQGSSITIRTGVALVSADVIECIGHVSGSGKTVSTYTPSVSAGDNTFNSSTTGMNGFTLAGSDLLNVYLNGVLLDSSDYTSDASADSVAITNLASGDVVHIQVIGALDYSNFVPAGGGTFSGNVAVTGDLTVDTSTLKVDSSNNRVGINTASPISSAHISTSATDAIPTNPLAQNTDNNVAVIVNTNNSANYSGLKLETRTSGASAWLIANEWQSQYLGDLVFRNRNAGTTSEERMRIDSSGNVGINTDSPDANSKLHISGGSTDYHTLVIDTTASGGGGMMLRHSAANKGYVGTAGSTHLSGSSTDDILVRATNKLLFASNGNNKRLEVDTSGDIYSTGWTDYGSSVTLGGVNTSAAQTKQVHYKIIGKLLFFQFYINATSNGTNFSFNLPKTAVDEYFRGVCAPVWNNGVAQTNGGGDHWEIKNSNIVHIKVNDNVNGFSSSGQKLALGTGLYQFV